MPELPEVETIVRGLKKKVAGKKVRRITVIRRSLVEPDSLKNFNRALGGQTMTTVSRRGKFILISFSKGHTLIVHLRMTGGFVVPQKDQKPNKFTRMLIEFDDGTRLFYNDLRALGRLCLLKPGEKYPALKSLGPEPLEKSFTADVTAKRLGQINRELKDALMDQKLIAGIGNIYASEICFRARLGPFRRTTTLTAKELRILHRKIVATLEKAIEFAGTTFSDYRDVDNSSGRFQKFLKVYMKEGGKCPRCKATIVRTSQKQRSTFYCPGCQR